MTTELRRVSLGEFADNLAAIIERVASAGESVVVENDGQDVVVVNPAVPQRPRKLDPIHLYEGLMVSRKNSTVYEALKKRLSRPPSHSGRASKTQCSSGANLSQ